MTESLIYTAETTNAHPYPGTFIAFEGGDGAGKSTQIKKLAHELTTRGYRVLVTREPGGTEIGEALRSLLLDQREASIDAHTEALMMAAARAAHVHQKIIPALAAGTVVLCDRYIDSSAAYQGAGRELGVADVTQLNLWAVEGLLPDLTVLLDVPLNAGRTRSADRGTADRMEAEPDSFHTRVHRAFSNIADQAPQSYAVIDGTGTIEQVGEHVLSSVLSLLEEGA